MESKETYPNGLTERVLQIQTVPMLKRIRDEVQKPDVFKQRSTGRSLYT